MEQPELFCQSSAEANGRTLRHWLHGRGWQTRSEICAGLAWTERTLRQAAETLGCQIIRGQAGFKLASECTREDFELIKQAADAAHSQAKKQERYSLGLQQLLHTLVHQHAPEANQH